MEKYVNIYVSSRITLFWINSLKDLTYDWHENVNIG